MRIEQIIQEKEQFYNYYKSLGYDHKTAAALALFTYGQYRFEKFSIDGLYEALCRGEEYLPPEIWDARKHMVNQMRRPYGSRPLGYASLFSCPSINKNRCCRRTRKKRTWNLFKVSIIHKIQSTRKKQLCRRGCRLWWIRRSFIFCECCSHGLWGTAIDV